MGSQDWPFFFPFFFLLREMGRNVLIASFMVRFGREMVLVGSVGIYRLWVG
jgi:hypothetical protein